MQFRDVLMTSQLKGILCVMNQCHMTDSKQPSLGFRYCFSFSVHATQFQEVFDLPYYSTFVCYFDQSSLKPYNYCLLHYYMRKMNQNNNCAGFYVHLEGNHEASAFVPEQTFADVGAERYLAN